MSFPGGSVVKKKKEKKKNTPAKAGDTGDKGLIPGPVRSPEGGNGISIQYSSLKKLQGQIILGDYSPWDHKESDTTEPTHIHHL